LHWNSTAAQGDELDAKIRKAEKEVAALEATLLQVRAEKEVAALEATLLQVRARPGAQAGASARLHGRTMFGAGRKLVNTSGPGRAELTWCMLAQVQAGKDACLHRHKRSCRCAAPSRSAKPRLPNRSVV